MVTLRSKLKKDALGNTRQVSLVTRHYIVIPSVCVALLILLIVSHIGDAMVHYVSAQDTTIIKNNDKKSSPYTSINSMLNLGSLHKVSIPLYSQQHPIMLTDAKKQQLMQQNQPDPALASSGEPIQGPAPGTQTSLP
jgi:hypothetical protein